MAAPHYIMIEYVDDTELRLVAMYAPPVIQDALTAWIGGDVLLGVINSTCTLFEVDLQLLTNASPVLPLTLTNPTLWHLIDMDFWQSDDTWQLESWFCNRSQTRFPWVYPIIVNFGGSTWTYKRKARVWDNDDYPYEYYQTKTTLTDGSVVNSASQTDPQQTNIDQWMLYIQYRLPAPGTEICSIPDRAIPFFQLAGKNWEGWEIVPSVEHGRFIMVASAPMPDGVLYDGRGDFVNMPALVQANLEYLYGGLGADSWHQWTVNGGTSVRPGGANRATNDPGNAHKIVPGLLPVGILLAGLPGLDIASQFGVKIHDRD